MATILDGTKLSNRICEEIKADIIANDIKCGLAVIRVGEDPGSIVYVGRKEKKANEIGIKSKIVLLPDTTQKEELFRAIDRLNSDKDIHGILVQLPLPKHLKEREIVERILPSKDVDGLHIYNAGKLFSGETPLSSPCTPSGIIELIKLSGIQITGKNAVVVGRSNIVGKPIAQMLLNENATVTICHSKTKDIGSFTRNADILVAAVGVPRLITADMVKPGAVIIDVGMNRIEGKLVGDVDFEPVSKVAGFITPVPGGVGPMTIAMLMKNCLLSAKIK